MFSMRVDCCPVAKGRPRLGKFGVFTPKKTKDFEDLIRSHAEEIWTVDPMDGPLECNYLAVMPIPKSWTKKRKDEAARGGLFHVAKPDVDNLAKAALDALNGVVFVDDSQIIRMNCRKMYGETPGIEISVWRAE